MLKDVRVPLKHRQLCVAEKVHAHAIRHTRLPKKRRVRVPETMRRHENAGLGADRQK
jgi:hypothetical protein